MGYIANNYKTNFESVINIKILFDRLTLTTFKNTKNNDNSKAW